MAKPADWTFRGRAYHVVHHDLDGYVDLPGEKKLFEIWVDPTLRGRAALEAWTHEALHALFPKTQERSIEEAAKSLGGFLWALGYRRRQQREKPK